jgi:hypothetical protein
MGDFLNDLTLFQTIFFVIAVSSTIVLVVQTILALVGIGEDGDFADGAEAADGDSSGNGNGDSGDNFDAQGLRLFTVRGIVTFLMVGAWVGFIASRAEINTFVAAVFAMISGSVSLLGMAKLMQVLMGLHQDGTLKLSNALGQTGTVYIRIPGNEKGIGKINVTVQERLCEFDAVTENGEELKTGERIYVTDIRADNVLVVEKAAE